MLRSDNAAPRFALTPQREGRCRPELQVVQPGMGSNPPCTAAVTHQLTGHSALPSAVAVFRRCRRRSYLRAIPDGMALLTAAETPPLPIGWQLKSRPGWFPIPRLTNRWLESRRCRRRPELSLFPGRLKHRLPRRCCSDFANCSEAIGLIRRKFGPEATKSSRLKFLAKDVQGESVTFAPRQRLAIDDADELTTPCAAQKCANGATRWHLSTTC